MGRPTGTGTGPARPLTAEEVQRLIAAAWESRDGRRNAAIVRLALGGGLRIGEVLGLRLGDVSLSDGSVLVEARRAKSRKSRRVLLAPLARQALERWCQSLPPGLALTAPLFPSRTGGHLTRGSRLIDELMAVAGITGASSHSLRRTHAHGLRDQEADLLTIQAQLGHANLVVTQRYLEQAPRYQRRDVDRLPY